ncbi:MAG: metal-dependent hydrolase [Elusimicrobia bacterium RIFOXYD12_FULL_66_9]|nr:MAG: metal-dependent hydrolase [Elusimicrobia bacterium RIFOXYD12_FULL_66_9]
MHCHVACLGEGGSGCFISRKMRRSLKYRVYLRAMGLTERELTASGDAIVFERLAGSIADSKRVSKAVVLALDGVVTDGELDREKTEVYVPDAFVARGAAEHKELLFGASVNPYRKDALERLVWAKKHGAVLVKWIPSIMEIDPADPRLASFYRKLAELKLPLLTHTGSESSFTRSRDELGDPLRLRLPLSLGVTVIAAHIAASGETDGQPNFERLRPLFAEYPKLYADISSLTQINHLGYLVKALKDPLIETRLLYGSDWPLQFSPLVSPWYQLRHIGPRRAVSVGRIRNRWDKDVALKEAMGVREDVFARTAAVLKAD